MGARQAVLLTPSKSSGSTQLLFYKQSPSVSPLFVTLTSRPQLTEKTATLSLFLATLTASSPVTPVFATLTKTAGVSLLLFPFWFTPRLAELAARHLPLLLYFHTLTNSFAATKRATPLFSYNSKLFQKNTGGGVGMPFPFRAQASRDRGWFATGKRTLGRTAQRCYARSCIIFGGGFWQVHE